MRVIFSHDMGNCMIIRYECIFILWVLKVEKCFNRMINFRKMSHEVEKCVKIKVANQGKEMRQ